MVVGWGSLQGVDSIRHTFRWSIPDVVMMFARVRRLSVVSVQAISGAGSIEYFIFVHTYYKYTTGLVFLCFRG